MIMRFSGNNGDNKKPLQDRSVSAVPLTVELLGKAAIIAKTQDPLFNAAQRLSINPYNKEDDDKILRSLGLHIKAEMKSFGSDSKNNRPK